MRHKRFSLLALLAALLLLAACNGPQPAAEKPADLAAAYQKMEESGKLPAMLAILPDMALDFYGIDTEQCTQWVLRLSQDSLIADEVLLIQAQDEAAAEEILGFLQGRMDTKAAEAITYSPEQYAIIKRGHLVRDGLFLALIVSPDADDLLAIYREFVPGT